MPDFPLTKSSIIRKAGETDLLFRKGRKILHGSIELKYVSLKPRKDFDVKVIFSVQKNKIRKANKRNTIKRQFRETFRHALPIITNIVSKQGMSLLISIGYKNKTSILSECIRNEVKKTIELLLKKLDAK